MSGDKAPRRIGLFQGYSQDTPEDYVRWDFTARYGHAPAVIDQDGGGVYAGPIEEKQGCEEEPTQS